MNIANRSGYKMYLRDFSIYLAILFALFFSSPALSQDSLFRFEELRIPGNSLKIRASFPAPDISRPPLIVFLHGAGERGQDNQLQLKHVKQLLSNCKNVAYIDSAIFLIPQCPEGKKWVDVNWGDTLPNFPGKINKVLTDVMVAIDFMQYNFEFDTKRIYLIGLSMGTFGILQLAHLHPGKFAALISLSGSIDLSYYDLEKDNIWFFNGAKDDVVSPKAVTMFCTNAKGKSNLKRTLYKDVGHNAWDYAFKECDLLPWLFSKQK